MNDKQVTEVKIETALSLFHHSSQRKGNFLIWDNFDDLLFSLKNVYEKAMGIF